MKSILTTLTALALFTGCGQTKLENELLDEIGLCHALNLTCGEEDKGDIENIYNRLDQLEALANLNRSLISLLQQDNDDLEVIVNDLSQQVLNVSNQTNINTTDIANLKNAVDDLEVITQHGVAELIDPCGDNPNQFDEIIIKLHSGDFIAYFETGGKRFLTALPEGGYRTTDSQRCSFSIDSQGELTF